MNSKCRSLRSRQKLKHPVNPDESMMCGEQQTDGNPRPLHAVDDEAQQEVMGGNLESLRDTEVDHDTW